MASTISITDDALSRFQQAVDEGRYPDIQSALDDASRMLSVAAEWDSYELSDEFTAILERSRAQIVNGEAISLNKEAFDAVLQQAMDEVDRGESVPFTEELNDAIFAEALAEYKSKQKSPSGSVE